MLEVFDLKVYLFSFGNVPKIQGWLGGAMVLGKLPVPGRPTYLD